MKMLCSLAVLAILVSCGSNNQKSAPEEILFQINEEGWFEGGDTDWGFQGEVLVGDADSTFGFVMTEKVYQNFVLELDFKPDSIVNSGVFVRCQDKELSAVNCYELNIWDNHPDQDKRTGSVAGRVKPLAFVQSIGKWNTYKVKCEGNRIEAWVNGTKTADLLSEELAAGRIGLQVAIKGQISFRNVKISVID